MSTLKAISDTGLELIKQFEQFRPKPYKPTPNDKLTIGYGHTETTRPDMMWSEEDALEALRRDVSKAERAVQQSVETDLNQNEYDALVSFVFNVGPGAFQESTLLKLLNKGDRTSAAEEFRRWIYQDKKALEGLARRREAEQSLFLSADAEDNNKTQRDLEQAYEDALREQIAKYENYES